MPFKVTDQGGEDFAPAPVGTHAAVCCSVFYVGMQKGSFNGQVSVKPKLVLQFLLPEEKNEKGDPHVVSTFYTASLHKKAKLRADLEAWRARPFTAQELEGFEITKILAAPCMVTIAHNVNAEQKVRAKVAAVTACPKGMAKPVLLSPALYYAVDGPAEENCAWEKVPEWVQKVMGQRVQPGNHDADDGHEPEPEDTQPGGEIPF